MNTADPITAITAAETAALAAHAAGTCHASEWSCSHCEADTHELVISHVWDDGEVIELGPTTQPGTAADAHAALAARWRAAGYDHERDAKALTLTRRHVELPYTVTVQHRQVTQ